MYNELTAEDWKWNWGHMRKLRHNESRRKCRIFHVIDSCGKYSVSKLLNTLLDVCKRIVEFPEPNAI